MKVLNVDIEMDNVDDEDGPSRTGPLPSRISWVKTQGVRRAARSRQHTVAMLHLPSPLESAAPPPEIGGKLPELSEVGQ